jgi:hypothetical protein
MSEKYYIRLDDETASALADIDDEEIVQALNDLVDSKRSGDELAAYDSVDEILADDQLSDSRKEQLRIKAQRLHNFTTR